MCVNTCSSLLTSFVFQKVESVYSDKGAEAGPYLELIFDEDEVALDIPKEGISLPSGWCIQPLVYPTKVSI